MTPTPEQIIPGDLREFLAAHPGEVLNLNAEGKETLNVQRVQLLSLPELRLTEIPMDTYEYHLNHGEFDKDPKLSYCFPAINIVAKELDDQFDPNGLLVWFPDFQRYGTWDDSHYIVYTFPHATWTDIIASPSEYFNAQWEPVDGQHELLMPWRDQGIPVNMEQFRVKTSG